MRAGNILFAVTTLYLLVVQGVTASHALVDIRNAQGDIVMAEVSDADIPKLVEYLVSGGAEARLAAEDLAEFGGLAVPDLLDALNKGTAVSEVLAVLGRIRDERIVVPVSKLIISDDEAIARQSKGALRGYGDLAVPVLTGLVSDPEYRDAAVDVLKDVSPAESTLKPVRALTRSDDIAVRSSAAFLLGRWKDSLAQQDIQRLLGDEDAGVRRAAAESYGNLHSDSPGDYDVGLLLRLLKDPDPGVREQAAVILQYVKDDRVLMPLIDQVEHETDPEARRRAVMALYDWDDSRVVLPFLKILRDEDAEPLLLADVIYALGRIRAREAAPYIVRLFEDGVIEDEYVQRNSFIALRMLGEPVELAMFLPYLRHGDPNHTSTYELLELIEAQAGPGDKEVIAALEKFRADEDSDYLNEITDRILESIK